MYCWPSSTACRTCRSRSSDCKSSDWKDDGLQHSDAAGPSRLSGVASLRFERSGVLLPEPVVRRLGRGIDDVSGRQCRNDALVMLAMRLCRMGPSRQSLVDSHGWLSPAEACSVSRAIKSLPLPRRSRNPGQDGFGGANKERPRSARRSRALLVDEKCRAGERPARHQVGQEGTCWRQAALALATWVAIASISAGDKQS